MGEAGLFADERVELLDGEIITMSPQNPPHAGVISRLASVLMRLLGTTVSLRVQLPIVLNDWSEPEPDIALCQPEPDDYEREHPRADQVLLVIEVSLRPKPRSRAKFWPIDRASTKTWSWDAMLSMGAAATHDRKLEILEAVMVAAESTTETGPRLRPWLTANCS